MMLRKLYCRSSFKPKPLRQNLRKVQTQAQQSHHYHHHNGKKDHRFMPYVLGGAGLVPFAWFAIVHEKHGLERNHKILAALKTDIDSIDRLIQLLGEAKTREHASTKLLGYGASILSFMGAIHWGAALVHPSLPGCSRAVSYSLSVVPSLLGWASLACLADAEDSTRRESTTRASLIQVTGFALLFCYDFIVVSKGRLPSWYISLRIPLTIGAVLSLLSPIMSTHDPLREIPNK